MKILLLHAHDFWLAPHEKSLPDAPDVNESMQTTDAVLALIHVEAQDPERQAKLVTKAIKNIKWLTGKLGTRRVVLHSFAHLASTNAEPLQADAILTAMRERLSSAAYEVLTTPFGYFNEFRIHVAGPSLAKVFVEL